MKQLLLSVFMLISMSITAQTVRTITAYKTQIATWNQSTKEWDWQETKLTTVPIHFGQTSVWVENQDQSTFIITKDEGESTGTTQSPPYMKWKGQSWLATDKRGLTARLAFIYYYHEDYDVTFIISYSDVAVRFYCSKNQLNLMQ